MYAINAYLFYTVESLGSGERADEVSALAERLQQGSIDRQAWQYRFFDTLARWCHWMAVFGDEDGRASWLSLAYRYTEGALQGAHGDQEVWAYQAELLGSLRHPTGPPP